MEKNNIAILDKHMENIMFILEEWRESMNEKQKAYYQKNREKILKRQKEYNARHKEEKAMYDHLRNMERWEEKAAYNREYYKRRKEAAKCANAPAG